MRRFLSGTLFGVTVTAALAGATALAGNGIGGVFNLGQPNTVTAKTALTGGVAGDTQLAVNNPSTVAGSLAIRGVAAANNPAILGANNATGPGLQGTSDDGIGVVAMSHSKTAPGAWVTNTDGGTGVRIDTDPSVPPLVVNSRAEIDNLNADQLDGLDATAFSRLLAMRMASTFTAPAFDHVNGHDYLLVPGFVPANSGRCLVTVSASIRGNPTADSGPILIAAIQRGTDAPMPDSDNVFGRFTPIGLAQYQSDWVTTSAVFDVVKGTPVRFGADIALVPSDWLGHRATARVTYLCMTTGTYAAAQPSQARHALRHQRSSAGSATRHHRSSRKQLS